MFDILKVDTLPYPWRQGVVRIRLCIHNLKAHVCVVVCCRRHGQSCIVCGKQETTPNILTAMASSHMQCIPLHCIPGNCWGASIANDCAKTKSTALTPSLRPRSSRRRRLTVKATKNWTWTMSRHGAKCVVDHTGPLDVIKNSSSTCNGSAKSIAYSSTLPTNAI